MMWEGEQEEKVRADTEALQMRREGMASSSTQLNQRLKQEEDEIARKKREENELVGTWLYDELTDAKYSVSITERGQMRVDEELPNGVKVFGILQVTGQWMQAKLISGEGKHLGTMRLRYSKEDDTMISNLKSISSPSWGKDIVATKVNVDPKNKQAAELLSQFFDTIERVGNASAPPPAPLPCGREVQPELPSSGPTIPMMVACDTARANALASGAPLAPFGYSLNRLKAEGGALTCGEATPQGSPLLALPLNLCWSASVVAKECPKVADELAKARVRNPESKLLTADATYIALHLIYEKRRGAEAPAHRRQHIALMPSPFSTMLAWTDRDMDALRGSRWQEVAKARKSQVAKDFALLRNELGPDIADDLGLTESEYFWARLVLQELGLSFKGPDGSLVQLLAPGLELMEVSDTTAPSAEGVRLEFGVKPTPSLVVYADRDYRAGDRIFLSHGGIKCATGLRLLGPGRTLEENPLEHAEIVLRLPISKENIEPKASFWKVLKALEVALKEERTDLRQGAALPPDVVEEEAMVKIQQRRGQTEARITVRLSQKKLLPEKSALVHLGLVICAHNDRMDKIMQDEKGVVNPLGADACERRALAWLNKRLQWALQEYPSNPDSSLKKMMKAVTDAPSKRMLGLRLVAAERQILTDAVAAFKERLDEPLAPEAKLEVMVYPDGEDAPLIVRQQLELHSGEVPAADSELASAVAQLTGGSQSLEKVTSRLSSLVSSGKLDYEAGEALKAELGVLQGILDSSPLAPMSAESLSLRKTADVVVTACGEAYAGSLKASLAGLLWDLAKAEKEKAEKAILSKALEAAAAVRLRLMDFKAAHADLQKSIGFGTASEGARKLALDCAGAIGARSEKVLAPPSGGWKSAASALQALRQKLKDLGYARVGLKFPWPARVPPVANTATYFQELWSSVTLKGNFKTCLELFLLRRPLPLTRVVELLGKDACALLLQCCALSCITTAETKLVEAGEAAKAAASPKDSMEVIANVCIWPVEDDVLAAFDFEQGVHDESFEPVIYLGGDSRALAAAAPRKMPATRVLDNSCGSGAQGLVALRHYATNATLLDSNPRALRFAEFGAHLNGLGDRVTMAKGCLADAGLPSGVGAGAFDAIVFGSPFLPNPNDVVTSGGPCFKSGGYDGERVLLAALGKAKKLLAPGGWITASSLVKDAGELATRVEKAVDSDGPSGLKAVIWTGRPMAYGEFHAAATFGLSEAQRAAFVRGVYTEGGVKTISEAMLLLWARPQGRASCSSRVVAPRTVGLWADKDWLLSEVPPALEKLLPSAKAEEEAPMYTLDWADGEAVDTSTSLKISKPCFDHKAVSPWAGSKSKRVPGGRGEEGATWDDLRNSATLGFAPPVLVNVFWKRAPGALPDTLSGGKAAVPRVYKPKPPPTPHTISLLELEGCMCPMEVVDALQQAGVKDRLSFSGKKKELSVFQNGLSGQGVQRKGNDKDNMLASYDVFVAPIVGWQSSKSESSICDLPKEVLAMFQSILGTVQKRSKPARLVVLTSGSFGPNYIDGPGEAVPAAAPMLGLVRAIRAEVPQIPIMLIDTDAIGYYGSGAELLGQLVFELEHATPPGGLWGISTQERAVMFLSNNRDVAYRKGDRWLPRVDLSPRMPIYVDRETIPMPKAAAEGAVIVTGGVGGIGLVAAHALAEAGALKIVLTSRTGETPSSSKDKIKEIESLGTNVSIEKCDTGKVAEVAKLLENVRSSQGKVSVVIHSAGVTDDQPVATMKGDSMQKVCDPKSEGAWHLHSHTLEDDLFAFVTFSSVAALHGSSQQANYATANSYLDELARFRAEIGHPSVSVQWPAVDLSGKHPGAEGAEGQTVGVGTVKQVVKQLVCGREFMEPVQAVLPAAYLNPSTPIASSLLAPLTARKPSEVVATA